MLPLAALYLIGALLLGLYFLFLRPRRGGKNAPPLVLSSPVGPLAMALEFGKGPVKMIERCYHAYGSVFTIPVRKFFIYTGVLSCRQGGNECRKSIKIFDQARLEKELSSFLARVH